MKFGQTSLEISGSRLLANNMWQYRAKLRIKQERTVCFGLNGKTFNSLISKRKEKDRMRLEISWQELFLCWFFLFLINVKSFCSSMYLVFCIRYANIYQKSYFLSVISQWTYLSFMIIISITLRLQNLREDKFTDYKITVSESPSD